LTAGSGKGPTAHWSIGSNDLTTLGTPAASPGRPAALVRERSSDSHVTNISRRRRRGLYRAC
jgi:hypothetical protein